MEQYLDKHRILKGFSLLFKRYFSHYVARDSAALTYYMLFALFPLMIFLSNLVGIMDVDIEELTGELQTIMPNNALELLEQYLTYVSNDSSKTLLWFSLVFSIYFPYRATNSLMRSVRTAYGLDKPEHLLRYQAKVIFCTFSLILTIAFAIAASMVGRRVLSFINRYFPLNAYFIQAWTSSRFIVLGVLLFFFIALLYAMAQEKRSINRIWPGVIISMMMWLLISWLFSLYVENAAQYSVIYGSIGTIIVLLIWLYFAATMLIMGAEINRVLLELQEKA